MPASRKPVHAWKDGEKFYTSLQPREAKAPKNEHASATEALREASRRGVSIIWDDPQVVG